MDGDGLAFFQDEKVVERLRDVRMAFLEIRADVSDIAFRAIKGDDGVGFEEGVHFSASIRSCARTLREKRVRFPGERFQIRSIHILPFPRLSVNDESVCFVVTILVNRHKMLRTSPSRHAMRL